MVISQKMSVLEKIDCLLIDDYWCCTDLQHQYA